MDAFYESLAKVQAELRATKDMYNNFGGYKYRSAESILASVKPLLAAKGLVVRLTDEVLAIGDRYYVKATCYVTDGKTTVETSALAREPLDKKGMDQAQVTGSSSSYARKYALSGMFGIDDSKADPDNPENHEDNPECQKREEKIQHDKEVMARKAAENIKAKLAGINDLPALIKFYTANQKALQPHLALFSERKKELIEGIATTVAACSTTEELEKLQNNTPGAKLKEVANLFATRFNEINENQIAEVM